MPILAIATEKEWDWFRIVITKIKERAKKSALAETKIFESVSKHMYTGYEEKVAQFIIDWIKKVLV